MNDLNVKTGVDFSKFDYENIFGVIKATENMRQNQMRPFKVYIQELSIEKFSNNQLTYIGDSENGMDFRGIDGLRYESKSCHGLFQSDRVAYTKSIFLKKFHTKSFLEVPKTFDYMLLWDSKEMSVGLITWEDCIKNMVVNDANIKTKIMKEDVNFIKRFVNPADKEDFMEMLNRNIKNNL